MKPNGLSGVLCVRDSVGVDYFTNDVTSIYVKLLSASLAGAGASLLAASLALLFEQPAARKKTALWLALAGLLLIGVSPYFGFDVKISVPDLNLRPLEEAVSLLADAHLIPEVMPSEQGGVELGRVLPKSQSVAGGQLLHWGEALTFKVSDEGRVTLNHPRTNNSVDCVLRSQGFCTFVAEGTSSKLIVMGRLDLVVWTKSRESHWFPQTPVIVDPEGSWKVDAQVGNSQSPPKDGESVEIELTVHPHGTGVVEAAQDGEVRPRGNPIDRAERVAINVIRER